MPVKRIVRTIAVLVALFLLLGLAADLVVDGAWFSTLGLVGVFWTVLGAKVLLFAAVFAASTALIWLSGAIAVRLASRGAPPASGFTALLPLFAPVAQLLQRRFAVLAGALVAGLLIAVGEAGRWDLVLRFMHQAPYGRTDPLFGQDIGFYLFSLPVYLALRNWLLSILLLSAIMAAVVFVLNGHIYLDRRSRQVSSAAIAHGSGLLGILFAIKAWSYGLDRYRLLFKDNGVVVGAGYADVHFELPVLWILAGLALLAAVACLANVRLRTIRLPVAAAGLVFGASLALGVIGPALFQRLYVKPSELQLETPYIQRNIDLTREAYNLSRITVKSFPAQEGLTYETLQKNSGTIDNIRVWDWRPLMDTYAQLQEMRTYYKFFDVEVDRYWIDGSYRQVTLAARELDPDLLPPNAQTWVNRRLLFTHGIGVVMSPVTQKSSEGLPVLYVKDVPPVSTVGLTLTEPRIYFGQDASPPVIVRGRTPEFDYPKGKDNAYASYRGADGIPVAGAVRRALFAWYLRDVNVLLSSYITGQSRVLLHRNIQERVRRIAPFLRLDHDPYAVVSGGRIYWMQDAYTTSRWFPYAKAQRDGGANYIRNSVKVVVDAYDGTVSFYLTDAADPIAATYRRIFPSLFKPFAAMPPDLQKHVRYPEDLFKIQAQQYGAYHMDSPAVFYNREDLWQFPRTPTAPDGVEDSGREDSRTARMEPYYIMMRLPGDPRTEFFIMLPMVPSNRENMIAWLAARCDAPDYGKLIVYEFPKDKLVYGPFQIEARINQNPKISQQISLWNQMGSRVIRGTLLVIPIENSILYVSPLYLRAESGQLPELKQVIAAYGDRVVMEETLPAALAALFDQTAPGPLARRGAAALPAGPAGAAAREALAHYDRALERLKAGDWAGFGEELDALRPLLEDLSRRPAAAPPATELTGGGAVGP